MTPHRMLDLLVADSREFFLGDDFPLSLDLMMADPGSALGSGVKALANQYRLPVEDAWLEALVQAGHPRELARDVVRFTYAIARGCAVRQLILGDRDTGPRSDLLARWKRMARRHAARGRAPPRHGVAAPEPAPRGAGVRASLRRSAPAAGGPPTAHPDPAARQPPPEARCRKTAYERRLPWARSPVASRLSRRPARPAPRSAGAQPALVEQRWCRTAGTTTRTVAHRWSYGDLRPLVLRAGELTPMETRRAARSCSPIRASAAHLRDRQHLLRPATDPSRAVAPNHRHSASAVRLIIEGERRLHDGGGQRCEMRRGDVILTPRRTCGTSMRTRAMGR